MPSPALCATSAARLRLLLPSAPSALFLRAAAASAALAPAKQRLLFSPTVPAGMAAAAGATASAQPAAGGGVSERIMPHLLNIYGSCATARDFEMYAPNATFEDPLMRAHGVKQIKSAFYTMPKILIDNKQHYKVFGKDVDLESLITLDVEDGKVVRHQDWWDKKPLKNRETVSFPLLGRLAQTSRRGAMLLTHVLMGFGKDPTP